MKVWTKVGDELQEVTVIEKPHSVEVTKYKDGAYAYAVKLYFSDGDEREAFAKLIQIEQALRKRFGSE